MIRDIIDNAVLSNRQLTITYSKDGIESNIFHLSSVVYSTKYGNNYIVGRCNGSELTFKVDKIINAEIEWRDVYINNPSVNADGLYLITCRSDMHLEFELRKYKKGDNILEPYQNEDGIDSWYSDENILAYHYIPFYTDIESKEWIPFIQDDEERKDGFYTFAYIVTDEEPQEEDDYDRIDDYDNWIKSVDFPCRFELCKTNQDEVHYCSDLFGGQTNRLRIPNNMKVLAYHYCTYYNEDDHHSHWKLAQKMGLI